MRCTSMILAGVLLIPALCLAQGSDGRQLTDDQKRAHDTADDLVLQCEKSRKAGNLQLAESQCLAAIETYRSVGWPAQGSKATLGMIYWEQGQKRLGFTTLRDAWTPYHGSSESELYLGRMAIELREYQTAREVVDRFRNGGVPAGSAPTSTRAYWPSGNDLKSLQATIEFLEGDRLCQTQENKEAGIKLMKHADKLLPQNVAICVSIAVALEGAEGGLAPAPYYRVVSDKSTGKIKRAADRWLAKHRKALEKAEEGKARKVT